ncbi:MULTISPECIES: hypothetical protein [Paenibacillus]|uniref:hypothetical protein n=1 Tax=Paenibacillus TaxID=44249 RepID=UPI000B58CF8A|nr:MULTISPECIES: hypothetical protein [Paenibacillus]
MSDSSNVQAQEHVPADLEATIKISTICQNIFKEFVLDVFYLIMVEKDIYKSEILQRFQEEAGIEGKSQKYRFQVSEALARLEGAMLIAYWKEGNFERYYLTQYGQVARYILRDMIEENPLILKGTKITSKFYGI